MDTILSIIQPNLSQRATLGLYYFETINNGPITSINLNIFR